MTATASSLDPLARKAQSDLIVERAAAQLRAIVHDMAAQLDPFPPFPGAFFTYGIEVEPEAAARRDRGCIVVAQDGELYELEIGIDLDEIDPNGYVDPVAMRKEELKKIDIHPRDYVVYAHSAIRIMAEMLLERLEAADSAAGEAPA
ncbi:MAG: hypothetical protein U0531_09840 [Dehalococcoidia bacterium]